MNKRRKTCIMITIYILIFLVGFFIANKFLTTIKVQGVSMNNTYNTGDFLLVKKGNENIQRNDVIVYSSTADGVDGYIIKRVIGLPGETILLGDNDDIYINGSLYEDKYGYIEENDEKYSGNITLTLKENEYYTVGDNRHHSIDSRIVGPVDKDRILGVVIYKLFPITMDSLTKK